MAKTPRKCRARQYSDQMVCAECGLAWDVNDLIRHARTGFIEAASLPSAPVWLGVVDELLTNIKRSCVRGRNAADPTPENSSFIATFDHIEDLAQQAQRALSRSAPVGVDEDAVTRALCALVPGATVDGMTWNVASFIESEQAPFTNTTRRDVIRAALQAALAQQPAAPSVEDQP